MKTWRFLSDEWFKAVDAAAASMGDLKVPEALGKEPWNLVVQMPDGKDKNVSMQKMVFRTGHVPTSTTTMFLEEALARKLFLEGDTMAGMFAFMSGDMRIEGDVTLIAALQTEQPSGETTALYQQIRQFTAP
jgi:hypothetical protein